MRYAKSGINPSLTVRSRRPNCAWNYEEHDVLCSKRATSGSLAAQMEWEVASSMLKLSKELEISCFEEVEA